jgi:hypothetical protein
LRRDREHKWILNGKVPEPCSDLMRWADWIEANFFKRHVGDTYLADDAIRISTIFLGIDYNFRDSGPPVTFETMIFGGEHAESIWRYSTWDQAERGHMQAVALATQAIEKSNVVAELLAGVVIAKLKASLIDD